MSELFNLEDIFNVMIQLENLGNVHYSNMKDLTHNSKLKVMFEQLAKAELGHKVLYEQFKHDIISYDHEKVDQEYQEYISVLLNKTVKFLTESREIEDFEKGYIISVQLEKDTILFLNEIRGIVDKTYHQGIDKVIVQEKSHLKALYQLREQIN